MAFDQQAPIARTPTTISEMRIILTDRFVVSGYNLGTGEEPDDVVQSAEFELDILDQWNKRMRTICGNLVPHITSPQITGLQNFLNSLRDQAVAQVLPS